MISQRILLIGGAGYLGSSLYNFLKDKYVVDSVDIEWFGNPAKIPNQKMDYANLSKKFLDRYSIVILLAGHSNVLLCENNPLGCIKNNVLNFTRLVEKLSKQKFIYASSYRVYMPSSKPANEVSPVCNAINFYDTSKVLIDSLIEKYSIDFFGLRLATANGYSPNFRNGQIINKSVSTLLNNNKLSVSISNSMFSVLAIKDFNRACEQIIINKKARRGFYNLASFRTSSKKIISLLEKNFTSHKIVKTGNGTSATSVIDTTKFCREFNFEFKETLLSTIKDIEINYTNKKQLINSVSTLTY